MKYMTPQVATIENGMASGHDHRRVEPAQEEVEDEGGEQGADQPGLAQAVDAGGDLLGLVLPHEQVDARQQRVGVDVLAEDPVDGAHDVNGVGGRLLVDVEGHGIACRRGGGRSRSAAPRSGSRRRRTGAARASSTTRLASSSTERERCPASEPCSAARCSSTWPSTMLAEAPARRSTRAPTSTSCSLTRSSTRSMYSSRGSTPLRSTRATPGIAAQRVEHPRLEQLVVLRQVHPLGRDPPLDHRDVAGAEGVDQDRSDVPPAARGDLVELLATPACGRGRCPAPS